jgi:hypothetical protein
MCILVVLQDRQVLLVACNIEPLTMPNISILDMYVFKEGLFEKDVSKKCISAGGLCFSRYLGGLGSLFIISLILSRILNFII